ncbi:MAG TPA: TadE family protein [Clostridia bacterium]|nr:TadE family protein [Clostridia bacterium]
MRTHKFMRNRKGQAMVETIFVLPLLFLLIFGIIEFGRVYFTYSILSNAAREGARYAAVHEPVDYDDAIERMKNVASTLSLEDDDIEISDAGGTSDNVLAKVTYNLELIMPIVGPMIDKSDGTEDGKIALHASAEMRIE